jgi:hypothetical protein
VDAVAADAEEDFGEDVATETLFEVKADAELAVMNVVGSTAEAVRREIRRRIVMVSTACKSGS